MKQKLLEMYRDRQYDAESRTQVSLWRSLIINLLYVGVNVLSYALYRSYWFVILSVYYTILALMRFLLLDFCRRTGLGRDLRQELRRSRLCGWILMTINLTLSGAVLMILYQDKGYEYHGVLIYAVALFTFYITVHAVIDLVKYRKYKSPVMTAAKMISLSAALVSMLALETAMFSQFGAETAPEMQRIMIAATGGGVSLVIITMAILMIRRKQ